MIENAGGSTSADAGEGAIPPSPAPHIVHLRERCPGSPHEYDVVTLRPEVTNRMGIACAAVQGRATNPVDAEVDLALVFLRYGIASWSFEDHGPVPCVEPISSDLIEAWLPWTDGGYLVAEAANTLYADEVFRPFLPRLSTRSPAGPELTPTSVTTGSGPTPLRRSRRSSRTATAGRRSGA